MWRAHAGAHEQYHVLMPRLPVGHHLPLEGLELLLVVPLDVDQPDGHLAMPAAVVHLPEAALPDELADFQLLEGDVPLLEEDAGLAGLAREAPGREEGQVHLLKIILGLLGLIVALLILRPERERGQLPSASRLPTRFPLCVFGQCTRVSLFAQVPPVYHCAEVKELKGRS